MNFVYSNISQLEGADKVGTKQCVALVQKFLPAVGQTSCWVQGDTVYGNKDIVPGTAIATFVNGRYPNARRGNHAALFLSHGENGFWVMDQWADDLKKPQISSRFIRTKGKQFPSGAWPEGGNNAYAYSIIER